ncbi:hypothetical protein GCM10025782_08750 [Pedococcus ginsenosidimutans]|uniref:Uncharacterized protein n=1 Tax=Pedococcus ginsenosidimutans TaxID=490570 RepID=A0ABP8XTX7_9MICO
MAADSGRELERVTRQYEDALSLLAEHLLGESKIRALDATLEQWMRGLTSQPGYGGLRGRIALRWVDGESPDEAVEEATWRTNRRSSSPPKILLRIWLAASQGAARYQWR